MLTTTKQHPRFINVGGQIYQLETAAGDAAGREPPVEEPVAQNARELEQYLSGKGAEKVDSGKEAKGTEKSLTLPAASDKDNAANIPDKMTSPDKDFYTGTESKRDLKSFQLAPETEKQTEENNPQKLPAKIKVKGTVYELVRGADTQDDLPNLIKVKGEVYERVTPPPFIRVNGKVFVKLDATEAREVLAKSTAWDEPPKGWTKKSMQEYMESISEGKKHPVTECIRKIKKAKNSKIDDPGAFCASLARKLGMDVGRAKKKK